MTIPVIWSPIAYEKYLEVLKFWHGQSFDFAINLDDHVEKLLMNLAQFKDMCPRSHKRPAFRKCTILKRYALIYRSDKDSV